MLSRATVSLWGRTEPQGRGHPACRAPWPGRSTSREIRRNLCGPVPGLQRGAHEHPCCPWQGPGHRKAALQALTLTVQHQPQPSGLVPVGSRESQDSAEPQVHRRTCSYENGRTSASTQDREGPGHCVSLSSHQKTGGTLPRTTEGPSPKCQLSSALGWHQSSPARALSSLILSRLCMLVDTCVSLSILHSTWRSLGFLQCHSKRVC